MFPRTRARIVVLQTLFEDDMNPRRNMTGSDQFVKRRLFHFPHTIKFAQSLLTGVRRRRPELDQVLADTAEKWTLQRMSVTDRNVLRLGAYEILYGETPRPVAINEAIKLAKHFGAFRSGQFVNGILDRLTQGQSDISSNPI
jgi:N utilization substance protein B